MITIIAAIGKNNEIGKDNQLLWNIPEEMKVFIQHTKNKTVLMGRKTFESIGKPLPKRHNIVISNTVKQIDGVTVCTNIHEALSSNDDIVVIGGEQIYNECLSCADELIISHINMSFPEADSFFPDFSELFEQRELLHNSTFFSTYKYTYTKT